VNLTKKTNYFFNEPCTKEEYTEKVAQYNLSSYSELLDLKKKVKDFWLKFPVKYNHTLRILDSSGERVYDSKNVKDSYSVRSSENMRYCQDIQRNASNSYDYSVWGENSENMYECMTCGLGSFNIRFCFNCWEEATDLEYCIYCMGSKNCFGCIGLYKKVYCIFNKQYTEDEYFALREKIINHMNEMPYVDSNGRVYKYGEFFPFSISPVTYNESIAQDFFPMTAEDVNNKGYNWREPNMKEYVTTIKSINLPDDLKDISDDITKEVIECSSCNRAYKVIPLELQFYRRIGLPIPRICQNCRFTERFKFINPPKLWHRHCMKENCPNEFESSYAPERPEIVYCESCYQQDSQ
jgi:hypothetical protein